MNTSQDVPGQPAEQPAGHEAPPPLPPNNSAKFFQWVRGLGIRRGPTRWVGGVCSGLGERWGVDPVIVRGLVVVLTLFFGIGLLAYGVAWALLPEPDGRIHVEEVGRGHWSTGMTGAAVVTMLGLGGSGSGAFDNHNDGWSLWSILWIGAAIWVIYWALNRNKPKDPRKGPEPGKPDHQPGQTWYGHRWQDADRQDAGRQDADRQDASWQGDGGRDDVHQGDGGQVRNWQGSSQQSLPNYGYSFTPEPARYVKYREPRTTPRLGTAASFLAIGAAAVVGAVVLLLNAVNVIDLGGYEAGVAAAAAAVTAGMVIVVAGIAGRTAAGLGTFAVMALILAGALSLPPHNFAAFNDANWTPTSISDAAAGHTTVLGNGTIDLTRLEGAAAVKDDVQIPLNLVASNTTIRVPGNIPVQFKSELAAASLTIDGKAAGNGLVESTTTNLNPQTTGPGLVIILQGAATNVDVLVGAAP